MVFADDEVFAFDDGGTFGWHNGAFGSTAKTAPDGSPTGCEKARCYCSDDA